MNIISTLFVLLLHKTDGASEKLKQASFFARLVRFFTHLALSLHKIGCIAQKLKKKRITNNKRK